jgi:hypothetical protein
MKKLSATTFALTLTGSARVGTINKSDLQGDWVANAKVRGVALKVRSATKEGAFAAIVTEGNRVLICGKNDAALAREALEAQNARVLEEVARANARPLTMSDPVLLDLARELGVRLPAQRARIVTRKVRI